MIEFNEEYVRTIMELQNNCNNYKEDIDVLKQDIRELKDDNKAIYKLSISIETLCNKMNDVNDSLEENKNDIKDIKTEVAVIRNEPVKEKANFFDKAKGYIIGAFGSAVVIYLLSVLFPQITNK